MNVHDHLQFLHRLYCDITQYEIRYNMAFERMWFEFQREGFTAEDLRLVIAYLQKLYAGNERVLVACLRLRHLVEDTAHFAEYLAEARKVRRAKREHAQKASVLRATGRPPPTEDAPAESVGQVLERLHESPEFQAFVALKKVI